MSMRTSAVWWAALVWLSGSVAVAQWADPEQGDTGQWTPPPEQPPAQPAPAPAPAPTPAAQPAQGQWLNQERPPAMQGEQQGSAGPSTDSDHAAVVGHLGFGFFGVTGVDVGVNPMAPGDPALTVSAPAIGIRYWLSEGMGVDLAIGFGFRSVDFEVGSTLASGLDAFAFTLHAGIPIALHHAKHYALLLVPETDIGFGTGTQLGATEAEDVDVTGLLFSLGGRVGAEIHFGFIDIPELSLQASVGLGFQFSKVESQDAGGGSVTVSGPAFGTSVNDDPWDIFVGNVAAIYYF